MESIYDFDLESPSDTDCFISRGAKLHMFGPKWDRVSTPLKTKWTLCNLKLTGLCRL